MRTFVVLFTLVVAMSLGAVACGGGGEEPTDTPTTPPTVTLDPGSGQTPTAQPTGTTQPNGTPTGGDPQQGQQAAQTVGCLACHSIDGSDVVGPTWQGLYGSTRPLATGSTVEANDEYLHESIVDPNAKIVEGFSEGIMPQNYGDTLSEQQIQDIIAYIESLQ